MPSSLAVRAWRGILQLAVGLLVMLFIPAGTFAYWQGWIFFATFLGAASAVTRYLQIHDPALLERRIKAGPTAEGTATQKIIMSFATLGFIAIVVVPALDRRFGWSAIPIPLSILGDLLVLLGFWMIHRVYVANTYTAATIAVERGQTVTTTGPYAIVRHPMYAGGLVMLAGIPLALGSWWGFAAFVPIMAVIIWRLLDEEKMLRKDLRGYTDYAAKVRHRLIPRIW